MMHSVATWSMQDMQALKPACSSLNVLFTAALSVSLVVLSRGPAGY